MINQNILRKRLKSVSLESLSEQTGFTKRKDGKITPLNFVLSFFLSIQNNHHTLSSWAVQLGVLLRDTISYNAMKYAQNKNRFKFVSKLLQNVLSQQLDSNTTLKMKTRLLEKFNRVFLEDSTCFKLPIALYRLFPGSKNKHGKAAVAKIQLRYELKSRTYHSFTLQRYKDNDQKFAPNILQQLLAGDLVIRDLGYHVLSVFQQIIDAKAFFISRLRFGTNLYHPQTKEKIDLLKELKKAQRRGVAIVELQALVGQKAKVNARIVAIKSPAKVTRKRRKKARINRRGTNHSKAYFDFLGWTIFITNVEKTTLSAKQILQVYGYRWRIEIIFKCWKSHFHMNQIFKTQAKLKMLQIKITVSLFLVWLTLFFTKMYNFFLCKVYQRKQKLLSLLKFAKFVKVYFSALIVDYDNEYWLDHLDYYCTYKSTDKQPNYLQQVFMI